MNKIYLILAAAFMAADTYTIFAMEPAEKISAYCPQLATSEPALEQAKLIESYQKIRGEFLKAQKEYEAIAQGKLPEAGITKQALMTRLENLVNQIEAMLPGYYGTIENRYAQGLNSILQYINNIILPALKALQ